MNYVIAMIVAMIGTCLSYATLDIDVVRKIRWFDVKSEDERNDIRFEKRKIYVLCVVNFIVTLICSINILLNNSEILNICKMQITLLILVGSANFDFREQRIPNIFPLVLSICAMAGLVIGVVIGQEGAVAYITSSVFACVGCAVCLTVATFLTKQGIGAGDIKLLSSLALMGGVYLTCGVLFFSLVVCFLVAVILLITKKETLKSTVPFAPFILIGFVISILISMY